MTTPQQFIDGVLEEGKTAQCHVLRYASSCPEMNGLAWRGEVARLFREQGRGQFHHARFAPPCPLDGWVFVASFEPDRMGAKPDDIVPS